MADTVGKVQSAPHQRSITPPLGRRYDDASLRARSSESKTDQRKTNIDHHLQGCHRLGGRQGPHY